MNQYNRIRKIFSLFVFFWLKIKIRNYSTFKNDNRTNDPAVYCHGGSLEFILNQNKNETVIFAYLHTAFVFMCSFNVCS